MVRFKQGRLEAAWLDEVDYVGAWQSESLAAVVLPTANTLPQACAHTLPHIAPRCCIMRFNS